MNTRRKFLLQGGMATTALLAAKPFQTFAKIAAPVTGFNNNSNAVLLLHSNDLSAPHITTGIKTVKHLHANVAVFNTGTSVAGNIKADAGNNILAANDYELFYKGDIKIGVLNAGTAHSVDQLNSVATFLKKEKACDVVVCLSQLGFTNKAGMDDRKLAGASAGIDVILGGIANNSSQNPYIVLNKEQHEVIISHNTDTDTALAQVAIQFNDQKQKMNIAF